MPDRGPRARQAGPRCHSLRPGAWSSRRTSGSGGVRGRLDPGRIAIRMRRGARQRCDDGGTALGAFHRYEARVLRPQPDPWRAAPAIGAGARRRARGPFRAVRRIRSRARPRRPGDSAHTARRPRPILALNTAPVVSAYGAGARQLSRRCSARSSPRDVDGSGDHLHDGRSRHRPVLRRAPRDSGRGHRGREGARRSGGHGVR